MDWRTHIVADPEILAGKPVVKGTRLSVEHVVALLAAGWSIDEVTTEHTGLTREHVLACLEAARRARDLEWPPSPSPEADA